MITTPTIYAQDEAQISNDLLPPQRRLPVFLAWLLSILTPLQWLHDLVFTAYYGGSSAANWDAFTIYHYGTRVKYKDYAIYEVVNPIGSGITGSVPGQSSDWMKVLDTFVGVGERVLYTGQTAMLEYILNYYFSVGTVALPWTRASQVNQIYISLNTLSSGFWLTNASGQTLTSYMANAAPFQKNFMHAASSYNPYAFTINVPVAVDAAITANQVAGVTAKQLITTIVQKYCQCNFLFSYATY